LQRSIKQLRYENNYLKGKEPGYEGKRHWPCLFE
jgi:hypothetical protein